MIYLTKLNRHWHINVLFAFTLLLQGCASWGLSSRGSSKLNGKTIVIIGASSGFGKGVAIELARCHANIVIAAPRKDLLDIVAKDIAMAGGTPLVVPMDVSQPADVKHLATEALNRFGHIDVWINNAGIAAIGNFWDIPVDEHAKLIDVNLKGVIYGCHEALKIFRGQGYGTLINTGSGESEIPLAYQSSYSASKAAIRSLGEVLHQELRLDGNRQIRVVTILPWASDTPWWKHAANHSGGKPRMMAIDPPGKTINAIMFATLHRRREVSVGWKAKLSYTTHRAFPHFTERIGANIVHRYQIKTAPPAKETSGTLFEHDSAVGDIEGGMRKRQHAENKERRKKNKVKYE